MTAARSSQEKKAESKQSAQKPTDWTAEAKSIVAKVHEFCVLGSTNKDWTFSGFADLLLAIDQIFAAKSSTLLIELSSLNLQKNTFRANCMAVYRQSNPKLNEQITYLSLSRIAAKDGILPIIKKYLPHFIAKFAEWDLRSIAAVFSGYFHTWNTIKNVKSMSIGAAKKLNDNETNYLSQLYGLSPITTKKDQDFFFQQTLHQYKRVRDYGTGNCSHMADGAFLEAISRGYPCQLIRFTSKENPDQEELNSVILNPSQTDSLLLSPWLSKTTNQVVLWQGSVKATPFLRDLFDTATVVFSADEKSIGRYQRMLKEAGYETWLQSKTRQDNLKFIADAVKQFKKTMSIIKKEKEQKAEQKTEHTAVSETAAEKVAETVISEAVEIRSEMKPF